MPLFEYQAVDASGKQIRGTISASSVSAAAADLESRQLKVNHLGLINNPGDPIPSDFGRETPGGAPRTENSTTNTSNESREYAPRERSYVEQHVVGQVLLKPPLSELAFFFRQMSTMLKAGVGIVQSLDTLANQQRDPRIKPVLREMRDAVQNGQPLSTAMVRYPEVFSPLMISLTITGEQGGLLEECFRHIADYVDRDIRLRQLYRRLTFYPKTVVASSIFIILCANWILNSLGRGGQLWSPLTSLSTWMCLGPVLAALFIWFRVIVPNPAMRRSWDMFISALPVIGHTNSMFAMAKFGRALSALYRGGVAIPQSVALASSACGNEYIRQKLSAAPKKLEEGYGIAQTLSETGVVNPIVLNMISTGETTGNLDEMLDRVSEFYEAEAETRATQMAYVVGAACLIAVGIYVGFVVFKFYTGYASNVMSSG